MILRDALAWCCMGAVNAVVPHEELEATAISWAREILGKSPTAIRMLKYAMNLADDGLVGQHFWRERQLGLPMEQPRPPRAKKPSSKNGHQTGLAFRGRYRRCPEISG
jgi:Dihydroxynaphthoic acid synthase